MIDVARGHVRAGKQTYKDQWVEFYVRLALDLLETPNNPRWLTPEILKRLASWSGKSLASVGKEVARHLTTLKPGFVEFKGRTKAWRLAVALTNLALRPNRTTVDVWLRSKTFDHSVRVGDEVIAHLVDAMLAVRGGKTERAEAELQNIEKSGLPSAIAAWNTVLRAKVHVQYVDIGDLEREIANLTAAVDPLSLTVRCRLLANAALTSRFQTTDRHEKALERAVAQLEGTGDLATLAVVLNILGLLARRAGQPDQATGYLQHALALSAICQDYVTAQGALFNLAQARIDAREARGLPLDESAFVLIELCQRVCRDFGVGSDSLQAELLATSCARKLGQFARARTCLDNAEVMLKHLDSPYEAGCWHRQRAKLAVAANDPTLDPAKDARIAMRKFKQAGAAGPAQEMARFLGSLRVAARG